MTGQQRRSTSTERAPHAANNNAALLTLNRAIADGISPLQLRQVAEHNLKAGGRRRTRQAENLIKIAERLELLGYRSAA
jgi:hypothetical protein